MATSPRSGFSLLEIAIVVGIIALVGSIVAMSVTGGLDEQRLRSALDELAVEIRSAQSEAALTGEERVLRYDLDTQRLSLEKLPESKQDDLAGDDDEEDAQRRRREFRSKQGEEIRSYDLPDSVKIAAVRIGTETLERGQVPVLFGPDGVAEAHRIRLLPRGEGTDEIALEIRGLTGEMVKLDPGDFDQAWDETPPGRDPAILTEEDFFNQDFGPLQSMTASSASGQQK